MLHQNHLKYVYDSSKHFYTSSSNALQSNLQPFSRYKALPKCLVDTVFNGETLNRTQRLLVTSNYRG